MRWYGKKSACGLSVCVVTALLAGRAQADTKIAVVNVPQVSESYERTKDLMAELSGDAPG